MPPETRRIASYGRRHGRRLRSGKKELLETLLPKLGIGDWALGTGEKNTSPNAQSPVPNLFWLEIGFGGGEHLAHMAALYPDKHFIGCETYVDGVASLLGHIENFLPLEGGGQGGGHPSGEQTPSFNPPPSRGRKLNNIRIFDEDARNLMEALPERSLERVFILYPDPWPKARHHKRRIISTEFLDTLARLMIPGAELRLATDYADYACWMLERLLIHPAFEWRAKSCDDWLNPWDDWLPTRYEKKALAGRPTYLTFVRS